MKRANYINPHRIEIIDYEETISIIEENYNNILQINHITDSDLELLKGKQDENSMNLLRLRELADNDRRKRLKQADSYLEFVPCDKKELPEYAVRKIYYEKVSDKVYEREIVVTNDKHVIQAKIDELKKKLSETDYVVIKSYEAKIMLEDAPYSQEEIEKIIKERKNIRSKINELQELLEK